MPSGETMLSPERIPKQQGLQGATTGPKDKNKIPEEAKRNAAVGSIEPIMPEYYACTLAKATNPCFRKPYPRPETDPRKFRIIGHRNDRGDTLSYYDHGVLFSSA